MRGSRSDRKHAAGLLRQGRFGEAEQAFSACVDARPRDPSALLGLGYLALLRNDLDEAERRLRAGLRRGRRRRTAEALLAELCYRRDDFEQAASLFRSAGRAAKARQLASFAGRRPNDIAPDVRVTRIPFVKTDPLPVLELCIEGSERAPFLVDTGGGELILDRAFASSLGIPRFGSERSYFGGGRHACFEYGSVEAVAFGDVVVRHLPVTVMDLEAAGRAVGAPELGGILGTVPLYHFRSTIDYPCGQLVLEPPAADHDAAGSALPFWLADDHFIVTRGAVNGGSETLFFVDTGLAGAGFTCPQSTLKDARIELRPELEGEGTGGGGSFNYTPFAVDELRLGDTSRQRIGGVTGAFPPQLEWELGFRIGGLVSHEFFRPYALTLDFAAMKLALRG
jgi:hypothetical protein